jgi:hypothetical protein
MRIVALAGVTLACRTILINLPFDRLRVLSEVEAQFEICNLKLGARPTL